MANQAITYPQYGSRGADVKKLQEALIKAGYKMAGGADGIFGKSTMQALMTFKLKNRIVVDPEVTEATWKALVGCDDVPTKGVEPAPASDDDAISISRLNRLHPSIRTEALKLYRMANTALSGRAKVRITYTLRTYAEQAELYAKGRTTAGPKVTNAKPGYSFHNWALALDFVLLIDGKEISWDINKDFDGDKKADWMEVIGIFENAGWKSGAKFTGLADYPHLEKTMGLSTADCRERIAAGKVDRQGYILI